MTVVVWFSSRVISSSGRPSRISSSRSVLLPRQAATSCSLTEAPWRNLSSVCCCRWFVVEGYRRGLHRVLRS